MFKHRTPEAILLTVPYTGTHFAKSLFETTGADQSVRAATYVPHTHWLDTNVEGDWDKITQTKLIITARDPYLSAIRSIKTKIEHPVEFIADAWSVCFKAMKESRYFILDIGCQEENRLEHALDAIRFIGITDETQCRHIIIPYVEAWLPENVSHSKYKTEYLETGKLPKGYNWSLLDEAVEWYNNLLTNNKQSSIIV